MKMYGSVENRVLESCLPLFPKVGMGATVTLYSDMNAYTIQEVSKKLINVYLDEGVVLTYPQFIIVTRDTATVIKGNVYDGSAEYEYIENKLAPKEKFIFNTTTLSYRIETKKDIIENGMWKTIGTGRTTKNNQIILVGFRREYFDPTF